MFGPTARTSVVIPALLCVWSWNGLVGAASLPARHRSGGLQRRIDGEHVVLADCRDGKGVVSSQMAYFKADPGPTPQDVAVVHTNPGEAALWVNSETPGLFTDTGVTFTATIGPKVADGQWAGKGDNGYGSFNCWQKYFTSLYVYSGTTCSQVYLCSHDPAPSGAAIPSVTNSPSSSPASASSSSSSSPTQPNNGLSQGAVIGVAVGVSGAVLLLASVGFFIWSWRRTHGNRQPQAYSKRNAGCCGLFSKKEFVHPPISSPTQDHKAGETAIPEVDAKPGRFEMDTAWERAEMGTDGHGRFEMEGKRDGAGEDWKPPLHEAYELYSPLPPSTASESPTLHHAGRTEKDKSSPE
ncbi:hypothetical protein QBC47DRAFT_404389 [Echria macrotheca]|uniref:Uncharacterized protein n=1 Tax=Echria macrotheca TaxID=438768 RepID=A0AAJ0F460_9PEZI|nr:hypothetical protein QBC47DRAFT_404389 [Echria macrotheca]